MSVVVSSEGSHSDDDSIDYTIPSSGNSQLVNCYSANSISYSSFTPSTSNSSSNNSNNTAISCTCTNTVFHLLSCPVPFSRRISLYFASPSSVLPRNQCTFNVANVMSQRIKSLSDASDAQKQLINVGILSLVLFAH